jgi:hypothetical protein
MRLLSRASDAQLRAGAARLHHETLRQQVHWLIGLTAGEESRQQLNSRLDGDDLARRRFAGAAAARIRGADLTPLERAARSSDPDVRLFATRELEIATQRGPRMT